MPHISAGVTLNASEAVVSQETFNRDQVACIVQLAFQSAAEAVRDIEHADLVCTWNTNRSPWMSAVDRYNRRMESIAAGAAREALRDEARRASRRPLRAHQPTGADPRSGAIVPAGEPVDPACVWPDVTVPGVGV